MSSFAVMWAPILFGLALFLSSGLLFMIQPMIGKTLLPHLGGNPLGWSACLIFFQATLLAGYTYADLIHRFRGLRWQPWVQMVLLAVAILLCFAGVFGDAMLNSLLPRLTSVEEWPIVSTISLLLVALGVPYFALAAVGPLVQRWFAHLDHPKASDPYFLFVASNLGGLSALVIYTLLIEPSAPLSAQWLSWKLALTALGVLLLLVWFCVWRSPRNPELEPSDPNDPNAPLVPKLIGRGPATWPRRLYWFTASALPVGLLMGVTDFLTLDLAPTPILWTLPLALYLLAFGQAFGRWAPFENGSLVLRLVLQILLGLGLTLMLVIITLTWIDMRVGQNPPGLEFVYGVFFFLMFFMPGRWLGIVQPLCVLLVVFLQTNLFKLMGVNSGLITLNLACFYLSVRLCLGMLAKDRPTATALTTYHGWIGIGGLGGGLFQLFIAPLIFRTAFFEYFFLAALASTLRPAWLPNGLSDWLACLPFLPKQDPKAPTPVPWRRWVALAFDINLALLVTGIAIALFSWRTQVRAPIHHPNARWFWTTTSTLSADFPLLLALGVVTLLLARPLRFGLALAAVVLACLIGQDSLRSGTLIAGQRTPFGMIRVTEEKRDLRRFPVKDLPANLTERTLMHATTDHGRCIIEPPEMRRYPTAYYHRRTPVGQVMHSLEWFGAPRPNDQPDRLDLDYWLGKRTRDNKEDDARIIASVIGMGATADARLGQMAAAWSEPSYAIVGLGVGTLYTYAHPYQWVDAYELDPALVAMSENSPPVFHYFQSAQERGVQGKIFTGDARRSLSKPGREGFYQVIFVDAFNSNAIPTHLLTQQAIELYLQKLAPEGLVCIHTSNRHLELNLVLERVARQLDLSVRGRAKGQDVRDKLPGGSVCGWVILARNEDVMSKWEKKGGPFMDPDQRGQEPFRPFDRGDRLLWTDDRASVFAAARRSDHWSTLIPWMLGLSLFVGALLALVEGINASQARLTSSPSLAPKK